MCKLIMELQKLLCIRFASYI